jgi:hypothetical protein
LGAGDFFLDLASAGLVVGFGDAATFVPCGEVEALAL